ncbi:MAG: hypothetical protein ACI9VR_003778 [Cognaticolwellia sp.]|jgi:hypothetical protein
MLLLLLVAAQAKPLTSAEFDDTAHTLAPGQNQIDVFRVSQFAITNEVELKTVLVGGINERRGWLRGPNVGVEYAIREGKQGALSVEGFVSTSWLFASQAANAGMNWTTGGPKASRFNLSANVGFGTAEQDSVRTNTLNTELYASAHWFINDGTTWRFYGGVDPYNSVLSESYVGSFGAEWNYAWMDSWRLAVGLQYRDSTWLANGLENLNGGGENLPPVLPLPSVDLWYFW